MKNFFLGAIIFFIMCTFAYAEMQYISFNQTDQIDIGREGWTYQPALQSTHHIRRTIHPSLKTVTALFPDKENLHEDFANYSKTIKIHPELIGKALAFYIPYQNSINKVSINNKVLVQVNQTTDIEAENEFRISPRLIVFIPDQAILNINIELVSSFPVKNSPNLVYDLGQTVYISKAKEAIRTQFLDVFIRTLLIGAIFIIGCFTTLFAYYRNREQYYYFFGLFTIFTGLRAIFATPYLYTTFSNFDWTWSIRLEFVFGEIMTIVFLTYIKHLYQQYFSLIIYYSAFVLMTILVLVTLLFEPFVFQRLFFYIFSLIILTSIYFFYLFFKTVKEQNQPYPLGHLLGLVILSFAFFHDFFVYYQIIKRTDVVLYCISVYVFFVTYEMSQTFSRQVGRVARLNKELKTLNQSLDDKIHLRTLELKLLNEKLDKQSKTDALTGIYNRGSLNIKLEEKFMHCKMNTKSLTIIMIDIDYFKCFNDFYGHLRGDILIKTVVEIIKSTIPEESFLARYGGEEFVVILEDISLDLAQYISVQICEQVASRQIEHLGRPAPRYVTISIGGITAIDLNQYHNVSEVLHLADMQLYAAKMNGRNQVRFHDVG